LSGSSGRRAHPRQLTFQGFRRLGRRGLAQCRHAIFCDIALIQINAEQIALKQASDLSSFRGSSGNFATFGAIRRASSRLIVINIPIEPLCFKSPPLSCPYRREQLCENP
jgi:hypothetical protein